MDFILFSVKLNKKNELEAILTIFNYFLLIDTSFIRMIFIVFFVLPKTVNLRKPTDNFCKPSVT